MLDQHVAFPILRGSPAQTRVPPTTETARPFDADDLPLEVDLTDSERDALTATDLSVDVPAPRRGFLRRLVGR